MGKEDYKNEKKGHGFLCVPKELLFDNRYKQLTIEAILLYFIELPMPSEKNISADTENVSDSIPAIRIKTKEGVSFEVFSNVSTEVLKYLIEVVIHAE